jgi:hypothetical protein
VTGPTAAQLAALLDTEEPRPNDGAMVFLFEEGEPVPADHPAVLAFPHLFEPAGGSLAP